MVFSDLMVEKTVKADLWSAFSIDYPISKIGKRAHACFIPVHRGYQRESKKVKKRIFVKSSF